MKKKNIIIDTDPGIDDAIAILMALNRPELNVVGLTSTFGNVYAEQGSANAFKLLDVAGRRDIPVATGSGKPLGPGFETPANFVHGDDGFGNSNFAAVNGVVEKESAAEFILKKSEELQGDLSLVTLGPLTNLAEALRLDSSLSKRIKDVVVMGGAVNCRGNISPAAEANIFNDPTAADEVCGADWDLTLVGLNVTAKTRWTGDQLANLYQRKFGDFFKKIIPFYYEFYVQFHDFDGICLHDPSTIAYLIRPDLFQTISGPVRVVTEGFAIGQTIQDQTKRTKFKAPWQERPDVSVCVEAESHEVEKFILESF